MYRMRLQMKSVREATVNRRWQDDQIKINQEVSTT